MPTAAPPDTSLRAGWAQLPTETVAGITTFFASAYIIVVNPLILSTDGTGVPFSGVLTATVFVCVSMTFLMGIYAKLPFVVASGMGINAFFTYTIILRDGVPWPTALGLVFWAGVLFLLVSITRVREAVATAIPGSLRGATAAGIGMLIALIGLRNGHAFLRPFRVALEGSRRAAVAARHEL